MAAGGPGFVVAAFMRLIAGRDPMNRVTTNGLRLKPPVPRLTSGARLTCGAPQSSRHAPRDEARQRGRRASAAGQVTGPTLQRPDSSVGAGERAGAWG